MSSPINSSDRPKPATSVFTERRNAVRYPAVANRARLGWWTGDVCSEIPAQVRNISLHGASLRVEERPPLDQALWLRVEAPSEINWIPVTVVRVAEAGEVAVMFPGQCPHELFKALVPDNAETVRPPDPVSTAEAGGQRPADSAGARCPGQTGFVQFRGRLESEGTGTRGA